MNTTLRSRFVIWLVLLCIVCFGVQSIAFFTFEWHEIRNDPTIEMEEEREEALVLVGAQVVAIPFVAFAVWFISGRMLRPVQDIAATAERIRQGRLDERIPVRPAQDELARLGRLLNDAFDRYDEAVARLDRFSADASHQLRTPLTAMRTSGEVALHRERSAAEYREAIEGMLEEVHRMAHVVDQLLMLARVESEALRRQFVGVGLAAVASRVAERLTPAASARGVSLECQAEGDVEVHGDEGLLEQALSNLVDNALRHSPSGGSVLLRVFDRKGLAVIEVSDVGPGVPAAFKPRLFERFSRSPDAKGAGSGLGLAIVADIAKLHRGAVEVADNQPTGAVFRIVLPSIVRASSGGAP